MVLRPHPLDGALLFFDRATGENLLLEGPHLARHERRAPRVVQFGLTNRCNLSCGFCFRDRALPSAWSAPEILAWAKDLAAAGVLEIAFGQGEPLAFAGFPALVRALHESTPLAVGLTTNGLLLGPEVLDQLEGAYGQIRLSFYESNDPFTRAALLARRGARFGANLLVTPATLAALASTLDRLVDEGCRDVLLLSYNGPDERLHLTFAEDRRLAQIVLDAHARHGDRLALKLSVCFGDRLPEVPRVVAAGDCGAGDDFIAIDSARRMHACSFHAEDAPVRSAAEAIDGWRRRRRLRSPAGLRGCARRDGEPRSDPPRREPRVTAWQGWASNHSSSYTLVGEMPSAIKAAAFVTDLERLIDRCELLDEDARTRSQSVWEILGRRGEPPHPVWRTPASTLSRWRPLLIAAGGRRVLVHETSTLENYDLITHLLLERHGRALWHAGDEKHGFDVIFGAEVGDRAGTILHAFGLTRPEHALVGTRLYLRVPHHNASGAAQLLRDLPSSLAVVRPTSETLAEALERPLPLPPRKRRVEWLIVERCSLSDYKRLMAEATPDPAAALARTGWTRPYRWPSRLTAHALLGGLIVRVEGAPVPAALQHYLLHHGAGAFSVVDRPEVRIRLDVDRGSESDDPPVRSELERRVAAISEPGFVVDMDEFGTKMELLPRHPIPALSQARSLVRAQRRTSIEVLPAWPLADAIARIQADLG
ncbi:MAG: radical SAM protein [Minicystis sp.]